MKGHATLPKDVTSGRQTTTNVTCSDLVGDGTWMVWMCGGAEVLECACERALGLILGRKSVEEGGGG